MTIYSIMYRNSKTGKWWRFRGNEGTGLYLELKTARSIATRLRNRRRFNDSTVETIILEAEVEWVTVEIN